MSLSSLINRPCTLRHLTGGSTIDRDGNEIPEYVEVATVCELQQRRRTVQENVEEISDTAWIAFLLPGESVGSGDQLIVDGETFEVDGEPWNARNPRTRQPHHIEVSLRRKAAAED